MGFWFFWTLFYYFWKSFLQLTYATKWEEFFGVIYFWMGHLMNTGWAKNSPNFKSGQNWFFLCYIIFSKFFYGIQFRCWVYIKKYHFQLGSWGWTRGPILKFHLIFCYFDHGKKCPFQFFLHLSFTSWNYFCTQPMLLSERNFLVSFIFGWDT
jgi:hypothetical protein